MLKAIILDMDGVLVDSAPFHFRSWSAVYKKFGVNYTEKDFQADFGKTSRLIIRDFLRRKGVFLKKEEIEKIDEEKEKQFRKLVKGKIKPLAGAIELIKEAKRKGLKIAIASSGPPENIQVIVKALKIRKYLDAIVNGKEVKKGKPAPEIFLRAAKKLKVSPEDCLVIEDALVGIEAAKKGGMFSLALSTTFPRERLQEADFVFDSLEEVNLNQIIGKLKEKER